MNIEDLRHNYHRKVCERIIRIRKTEDGQEFPNFSDVSNRSSVKISLGIIERFGCPIIYGSQKEQTTGDIFEIETSSFLEQSFQLLSHLRPGNWLYTTKATDITRFDQYSHLAEIEGVVKKE